MKIDVCECCRSEKCSGQLYKLAEKMEHHPRSICESQTYMKDGVRCYRYVRGMGQEWDVPVEEEK